MHLKYEDIEKYDKLVRRHFLLAQMRKVGTKKLIWTEGYARVATLEALEDCIKFKFEKGTKCSVD